MIENDNEFWKNFFIIALITITIIIGIIWVRRKGNSEFDKWFHQVCSLAPQYNFHPQEIECFEEIEFYVYFMEGKTPEQALFIEKENS